ncbi:MAG: hypothetical protein IT159_06115 [Bryobacterales bacterium]|nr:hypothetical protein [Bryobacterales bacterium]
MLAFVVPLKSAAASNSWDRVTRLVRRTLRSVCAQTCPDFRAVVACHDIPDIGFEDERVEYLRVDFPPPGPDLGERIRDCASKTLTGLHRALALRPAHVMLLDADDCVSNRLAAHAARHPDANGWYINRGYFWREGLESVHVERRRFHQWCGSSHIYRRDLLELPPLPARDWFYRHSQAVRHMRERGTPLSPLPFPGAVYLISHGDNMNDYAGILWPRNPVKRLLRRVLYHRSLTPGMRAEFGLYPEVEAAVE